MMTPKRLGALTISQSPREDLLQPLVNVFSHHEICEAGALDTLDVKNLPDGSNGTYPLTTRLNSGEVVTLDRDYLAPLVQSALDQLEAQGCDIILLLCAGDFPTLQSRTSHLIKPTQTAQNILSAMNMTQLAIISPIAIQNKPIENKWRQAGFTPTIWTMPDVQFNYQRVNWINRQLDATDNIDCVILDYVGYPIEAIHQLQAKVKKPLFELGELALGVVKSIV